MSREWKRGDVAMVMCSDGNERMAQCGVRWLDDSLIWLFSDKSMRDVSASSARPVAWIDPDDTEQVERLARCLPADWSLDCVEDIWRESLGQVAAALREFADPTPPKPAEPQGLGAVVVDAEGRRYVRCSPGDERWHCPDDDTGVSDDHYRNIPAVRVLSEGVTE